MNTWSKHASQASAFGLLFLLFGLLLPEAHAQQVLPGVTASPGANGTTNYSVPIQTLLFLHS